MFYFFLILGKFIGWEFFKFYWVGDEGSVKFSVCIFFESYFNFFFLKIIFRFLKGFLFVSLFFFDGFMI